MTAYRWGQGAGGEIPSDAPPEGHGWLIDDETSEKFSLWVARSLPDMGPPPGSVRLGYVRRGSGGAMLGRDGDGVLVQDYEVLLDKAVWEDMEMAYDDPDDEDTSYRRPVAGAVVCGHSADGAPLYASRIQMDESNGIGTGFIPSEDGERASSNMYREVLVEPAVAGSPAPDPEPAQEAAVVPAVVVSKLDCKSELVEITNAGSVEIDLSGWKLRDRSARKPYAFPAGTLLAAGASVRVRSGPGAAKPKPGELKWTTASVWGNRGDTARLFDPAGSLVSTKEG